jgi:hypothetical protein
VKEIKNVNIGVTRASEIDTEIYQTQNSVCLAGHPVGSQAFDLLNEHAQRFLTQSLLGRGFEKYDGTELTDQDVTLSRRETVGAMQKLGVGKTEATEAVRSVEKKVTAALTRVLGKQRGH